jgi:precorrin-6Y C5,15-methyltransferase (decarboxylating)
MCRYGCRISRATRCSRGPRREVVAVTVTVIGIPIDEGPSWLKSYLPLIAGADLVAVAPSRLLAEMSALLRESARIVPITGDIAAVVSEIEEAERAGKTVAVLATGDPGFFGIGRALADRLGPDVVKVRPAASSIAVAFGRVGLPWDDAIAVSAHGRPLDAAIDALRGSEKAAVLTGPDAVPERLGAALVAGGISYDHAAVASDLGSPEERVESGDLRWLAGGKFSPLSVVLLWNGSGVAGSPVLSTAAASSRAAGGFGRLEASFEHRDGMITKSEVRAICLAHLELPPTGVLWDVGAGSGSVGIEAASLSGGLQVVAVERCAEDAERIRRNADRQGVAIEVVNDEAPACLSELPRPDRVFVGGGGIDVLDEVLARLSAGGRVVATYASMDRAVAGATRLGNLVQISASRGTTLPDGTWRLHSLDPVFVCWGPDPGPDPTSGAA